MIALHFFSGDLVIDIELFLDYHNYVKCYVYSKSYIFILFAKMSFQTTKYLWIFNKNPTVQDLHLISFWVDSSVEGIQ